LKQLFELEQSQAQATLPAPRFDFSYLPASPAPGEMAQSWRLDELGRLIIRFSAGLLQTLQSQTQQPDFALERSPGPTEISYHYALQQTVEDCNVAITVRGPAQDSTVQDTAPAAGLFTVVVVVESPSRGGWPNLAGTTVALKRGDALLHVQQTDAFGKTAFHNLAAADLPQLVFEIG
jgi:hypothetical protein